MNNTNHLVHMCTQRCYVPPSPPSRGAQWPRLPDITRVWPYTHARGVTSARGPHEGLVRWMGSGMGLNQHATVSIVLESCNTKAFQYLVRIVLIDECVEHDCQNKATMRMFPMVCEYFPRVLIACDIVHLCPLSTIYFWWRLYYTCPSMRHWPLCVILCAGITCPSLPAPQHGTVSPAHSSSTRRPHGSNTQFTCNSGYTRQGATRRTCGGSGPEGVWSHAQPTCQR